MQGLLKFLHQWINTEYFQTKVIITIKLRLRIKEKKANLNFKKTCDYPPN